MKTQRRKLLNLLHYNYGKLARKILLSIRYQLVLMKQTVIGLESTRFENFSKKTFLTKFCFFKNRIKLLENTAFLFE